ncbi:MAG: ankyrin repeat domain-containing protein [Kiritimatiellia bacterium]|nr:ankyrin repeat domain-containing protein [Kiritimatiellia bacterium]
MKLSGSWFNSLQWQEWGACLAVVMSCLSFVVSCVSMMPNLDLQAELVVAIRGGSIEHVLSILNRGASPEKRTADGASPLEIAIIQNQPDLAMLLIDRGAKVDSPNEFGITPLMYAVKLGYFDIVSVLLRSGADPYVKNPNTGNTAIHLATGLAGRETILRELLRHTAVKKTGPLKK